MLAQDRGRQVFNARGSLELDGCVCALARTLLLLGAPFLSPNPIASIKYVLHHSFQYLSDKKLSNPEHRTLMSDWQQAFDNKATPSLGEGSAAGKWLAPYLVLAAATPIYWFGLGHSR